MKYCVRCAIPVQTWRPGGSKKTLFDSVMHTTGKVSAGVCEIYKTGCLQAADYEWQRLV